MSPPRPGASAREHRDRRAVDHTKLELALFGVLGNLVDFFAAANRETFWPDHLWWMIGVGFLILVGLPLIELLHEAVTNQGIMGNFPMRIRWLAYRYVLRQSMTFFENDFAGRVATKVRELTGSADSSGG